MARFLRASCLLSLLLAGFVPPGRGQEKSKVSEAPGRKTSLLRPGVHRAAGRATASPEAPDAPNLALTRGPHSATPGLCALPSNPDPRASAGRRNPGGQFFLSSYVLPRHLGVALPHSFTWDRLSHSAGFGEGVGSTPTLPHQAAGECSWWLSRKIAGGRGAGARGLKAWRHISFWASVSPLAGHSWRGERMVGRLWNPLAALSVHSPLASHGANTVAREANPGQAESSGAPSMLCGTLSRSRDGEAEGR